MTDIEAYVRQDGRAELVRQVRAKIDQLGISYIYYQFISVTGRIVGKGVPADHWESMCEGGFQLVYGATANLFLDRHGEVVLRLAVLDEQLLGHPVHIHVGRLGGEHHGDEELDVAPEAERDLGIRVLLGEALDDGADPLAARPKATTSRLRDVATCHESSRRTFARAEATGRRLRGEAWASPVRRQRRIASR